MALKWQRKCADDSQEVTSSEIIFEALRLKQEQAQCLAIIKSRPIESLASDPILPRAILDGRQVHARAAVMLSNSKEQMGNGQDNQEQVSSQNWLMLAGPRSYAAGPPQSEIWNLETENASSRCQNA